MLFSGGFSDTRWAADEKRETCFVFIGRDLDKQKLTDGFKDCRCSEEVRFKVGEKILAKVGKGVDGYFPGVVVKIWDEGNPYRIQLLDEEKTNIWGPIDDNAYVKAA